MKKFKPNVMATLSYSFLEFFPGSVIGIIVFLSVLFSLEGQTEYLKWLILTLVILAPLELLLVDGLFTLITLPFLKYYVFLYDEYFVHNNITVNYRDVDRIEIDSGVTSRYGSGTPCSLNFFIDGELITSIKKPPFTLTFILLRRCRHAAKKFVRIKSFIITNIIMLAIFLGLTIYILSQI